MSPQPFRAGYTMGPDTPGSTAQGPALAPAPPPNGAISPGAGGRPRIRLGGALLIGVGLGLIGVSLLLETYESYLFVARGPFNFPPRTLALLDGGAPLLLGIGAVLAAVGSVLERVAEHRAVNRRGTVGSSQGLLVGLGLLIVGACLFAAGALYEASIGFAAYEGNGFSLGEWTGVSIEALLGVGMILGAAGWLVSRLAVLRRWNSGPR